MVKGSVVVNDIPYFEPLLLHLKKDESLDKYFSSAQFQILPKVEKDVETLIKEECPTPRALYVYPGETRPKTDAPKGCFPTQTHNFHVFVFVQCLDTYKFIKNEDDTFSLKGQVILLSEMRNAVKKSIQDFSRQVENDLINYNYIRWVGDSAIDKWGGYLVYESVFSVDIF